MRKQSREKRHKNIKLPLDKRNRVCLTSLLPKGINISSFKAHIEGNSIVLEPLVEISAENLWLYENPQAMADVMEGLEDIKKGKVSELDRDFSKFINDDEV